MADASRAVHGPVVTPVRPVEPSTGDVAAPADNGDVPKQSSSGSPSNRRVMRGALALFSIQPLTWASSFLLIIYAPQYLDSAAMGQWAMLTAFAGLATQLLGLGVPTVLVRRIAADPDDLAKSGAAAMVVVTIASIIGCAVLAMAIRVTGLFDLPPYALELALATVIITLSQTLFLSILNGQHRLGRFAWLSATNAVAASLGIVAVLMAGGGLVGIMLLNLIVTLAVTIIGWRTSPVSFDWSSVNWKSLRGLVVAGLPFAGVALVLRLRGDSEVMLLGLGLSIEVLGWWSAAERISYIALFVPTLLATPLMPALRSVMTDTAAFRNTLRRSLDLTFVLTLGASGGIVAIAPAVPSAFGWGQEFDAAIPLIEILSLVTPIVSTSIILGTAVVALGDERRWFVASVVVSSLHLIVTPTGIVAFNALWGAGGIGAAMAKLFVELLMIGGAIYLLPRGTLSRSSLAVAAKAIIASGVMIAAVRVILTWESALALPAGIVGGGFVYLIALAVLRIMPPSELAEVRVFIRTTLRRKAG